jgi:hypothetical protein
LLFSQQQAYLCNTRTQDIPCDTELKTRSLSMFPLWAE